MNAPWRVFAAAGICTIIAAACDPSTSSPPTATAHAAASIAPTVSAKASSSAHAKLPSTGDLPAASPGSGSPLGPPSTYRDPGGRFEIELFAAPKFETERRIIDRVEYITTSAMVSDEARMFGVLSVEAVDPPRYDCALAIQGVLAQLAKLKCTSREERDRPLGKILGREAAFDCADGARGRTWVLCEPERANKRAFTYQLVGMYLSRRPWQEQPVARLMSSFKLNPER